MTGDKVKVAVICMKRFRVQSIWPWRQSDNKFHRFLPHLGGRMKGPTRRI